MRILDPSEIDSICHQVVHRTLSYNDLLHACLFTIYNTGVRVMELSSLDRWQLLPSGSFRLITVKGGGIREIEPSLIHPLFAHFILNPPSSNFIYSSGNIRRVFHQFAPHQRIFTKDKEISAHIFRHNKIKQLYLSGWTFQQIADYFAVSAPEVSAYYVNSVIYVL